MSALRILLVDDHPLFLLGLREVCRNTDGFDLVGEAGTVAAAVAAAADLPPDVIVLDLALPDGSGLDAVPRLRSAAPAARILMLTMFDDQGSVIAALRTGAHGYLVKGAGAETVERSIRTVAEGGTIVVGVSPDAFVGAAEPDRPGSAADQFPHLTPREREVLTLIAAGMDNRSMARRLFLADKTVRNLVSSVMTKIHATDRADAVSRARSAGLGQPSWRDPPHSGGD
jgi:DNA-binding NarL/FixJ family response regulator